MRKVLVFIMAIVLCCCKDFKYPQVSSGIDSVKSYILYIGTYTEKEAHVNGKAEGIYVYSMNSKTGGLTYIGTSPYTVNPSFLSISSDGKYLFAVNETGGDGKMGGISSFRLSDGNRKMDFINQVSTDGDYPCYVEADRQGQYVLVANYGSGNVSILPVNSDGSLMSPSDSHFHEGKGPTSRQESGHAHCIMVSPDGFFAYSCDLGTDKIYYYKIKDNKLESEGFYEASPGSGPRHLAFHPARNYVYSVNELNATIDCMNRDPVSGILKRFQTVSTLPEANSTTAGSADIHITPSGDFLYVTNRGSFNNISAFRVSDETGELNLIGTYPVKGKTPRNFAIDPEGNFLLVANQDSDQIVTFRIDQVTGRLSDTGIETRVYTPVCLRFFPGELTR